MSDKWNMIVDVAACVGCYNCALACKDEYSGNEEKGYFSSHPKGGRAALDLRYVERGQYPRPEAYYIPVMCNHCDNAPCMKADRDGAISKRPDGVVVFDPVKSKGKRHLADACPYGAVIWNEETDTPQTWIFDAHLLDRGFKEPRCVSVCPTGALQSIKCSDEAMAAKAEAEGLTTPLGPKAHKQRVYYRNYDLVTNVFVSGTVRKTADGQEDCAEGAEIVLTKDGDELARATSDEFGDFRIGNLPRGLGDCTLTISGEGFAPATVDLGIASESLDVGEVGLTAA